MTNDCCLRDRDKLRAFREGKKAVGFFGAPWKNPYLADDDELAREWRTGYNEELRTRSMCQ